MAFAKKMMGFLSDLVSFSNHTKLPSKKHQKIHVTFFTGTIEQFNPPFSRKIQKTYHDVILLVVLRIWVDSGGEEDGHAIVIIQKPQLFFKISFDRSFLEWA